MPKIVASKKDWIELGYKLFAETGEAGLNVDKMSRVLKCNKSSFYWHFKTKADFVESLIEHWIDIDTTKVIVEVEHEISPREKLIKLIEIAFKKDANLDFIFYLKKYSQKHKPVQKIVERIDRDRIAYVSALLLDIGYDKAQATSKSILFYKYLIGHHEMIRYKPQKKDYLIEVLEEINHFLTI